MREWQLERKENEEIMWNISWPMGEFIGFQIPNFITFKFDFTRLLDKNHNYIGLILQ